MPLALRAKRSLCDFGSRISGAPLLGHIFTVSVLAVGVRMCRNELLAVLAVRVMAWSPGCCCSGDGLESWLMAVGCCTCRMESWLLPVFGRSGLAPRRRSSPRTSEVARARLCPQAAFVLHRGARVAHYVCPLSPLESRAPGPPRGHPAPLGKGPREGGPRWRLRRLRRSRRRARGEAANTVWCSLVFLFVQVVLGLCSPVVRVGSLSGGTRRHWEPRKAVQAAR